jgi:endonuclease III
LFPAFLAAKVQASVVGLAAKISLSTIIADGHVRRFPQRLILAGAPDPRKVAKAIDRALRE